MESRDVTPILLGLLVVVVTGSVETVLWRGETVFHPLTIFMNNCAIVLDANDIMLLSSSVTYLERMLHARERELAWLDMSINLSKSCCLSLML